MSDPRKVAFFAISGILFSATAYSLVHKTYLDTSNPLLSHLPHPLSKTSYWAQKSNFLNVYFIKYAWGWTSAAFFFSWLTSSVRSRSRILKWIVETASWMIFTSWFFGPAVLQRVVIASGGECLLSTPDGNHISLPLEFCFDKSMISHSTHPQLFTSQSFVPAPDWHGIPRLKKGHDVSGHIFLLTMSTLFLADQLRPSIRAQSMSTFHAVAFLANSALILVWLFSIYTTGLYFHSPSEKITGYLLGLATFSITQLPIFSA